MTYRIRTIAIAIALAVLAAVLTGFYVTGGRGRISSIRKLAAKHCSE